MIKDTFFRFVSFGIAIALAPLSISLEVANAGPCRFEGMNTVCDVGPDWPFGPNEPVRFHGRRQYTPKGKVNRQGHGDRITSHVEVTEEGYLRSGDGRWMAIIQADGNFVLYGPSGPIWASGTVKSDANLTPFKLALQSDGNLVIYQTFRGKQHPIWASNTNGVGTGPYTLVMQNDANLVIYDRNGPIWATNTCCQ